MPPLMKIKTALISVFDKTGVVDFARTLAESGVNILSTGGTASALKEAGVAHRELAPRHRSTAMVSSFSLMNT